MPKRERASDGTAIEEEESEEVFGPGDMDPAMKAIIDAAAKAAVEASDSKWDARPDKLSKAQDEKMDSKIKVLREDMESKIAEVRQLALAQSSRAPPTVGKSSRYRQGSRAGPKPAHSCARPRELARARCNRETRRAVATCRTERG